ncbi:Crp/Fnr family transcriptional regulator [Emticicia sp. 21SJ11W-3]|uniref:Crp/Fnr family transcriptional regulator n=1 Tax=Emticicia sp. 21SJ11W-3 TaxID=2916755 RepID=UPI00209D1942|nr:Crp/Fnr family transcriptional regulator [Emticicia sp. 21SJ11W-3]UTA70111.1 Crp/Fnr family transcriptional regulator [Emticicia sp. 21SJ11W-3]
MTELERYINSYFGVEEEDLLHISSLFKPQTLKKGDFYLKTGRYCKKMSFVRSGLIRIYATTDDREVTQWISTAGYFTTDLASFVFEKPARWTIQALTDTELFTISKEDYSRLGSRIPKWHLLEKLFIARCFIMLEDRIFRHLSMSAEERYQFFFEQNKELFNQVPLQYLASMLGMTPETFSRIRRKTIS